MNLSISGMEFPYRDKKMSAPSLICILDVRIRNNKKCFITQSTDTTNDTL